MTQLLVSLLPFAVLALLWVFAVGHLEKHLKNRRADDLEVVEPESEVGRTESSDVWSSSGLIHNYRDEEVAQSTFWRPTLQGLGAFALIIVVSFAFVGTGLTRSDAEGLALFVGFVALLVYFGHRFHHHELCSEIRLSDDGTCELETKRRVIRLHVSQIRSVVYRRSSEGDGESYSIRFQDGKLIVDDQMSGFRDFLARLKTLNPAVDLSSFPADRWPGLATPGEARATALRRGIRGALFPVGVVILLIWLAVEALR